MDGKQRSGEIIQEFTVRNVHNMHLRMRLRGLRFRKRGHGMSPLAIWNHHLRAIERFRLTSHRVLLLFSYETMQWIKSCFITATQSLLDARIAPASAHHSSTMSDNRLSTTSSKYSGHSNTGGTASTYGHEMLTTSEESKQKRQQSRAAKAKREQSG